MSEIQDSASKPENESGVFRSVDVLAAQVRDALETPIEWDYVDPFPWREALEAFEVLVGYAKRAEALEDEVASLRDALEAALAPQPHGDKNNTWVEDYNRWAAGMAMARRVSCASRRSRARSQIFRGVVGGEFGVRGWTVLLELRLPDEDVEAARRSLLMVAQAWDVEARSKTIRTSSLEIALRPDRAVVEPRLVDSAGQKPHRNAARLRGRKIA